MKNKIIYISLVLIFLIQSKILLCEDGILQKTDLKQNVEYVVRLVNGDIISGYITEFISSQKEGDGIKLKTELGTATIFEYQILEIDKKEVFYRHNHRVFLLPTAEPIKNNHFIGAFEMLFLYAGFGLFDFISITVGRSIIPVIQSKQQLTLMNVKATFLDVDFPDLNSKAILAIGGNIGFVNHNNRMIHYYAVGTFLLSRTSLTASVFYKAGSLDYYPVKFDNNYFDIKYPDGAVGVALGVDSKISTRHDLHIIGELWNNDVARPTNTAVLLGLRICNTDISADFGFSFFTQPFIAPFMSFTWTPF